MVAAGRVDASARLARLDWNEIEGALWEFGYAKTPALVRAEECRELAALYPDDARFRSTIDMQRFRFGLGEYRYFAYPLPPLVAEMRAEAYRRLAPIAKRWTEALGGKAQFPSEIEAFLSRCHAGGQTRPTPLLLRYEAGGYNCLHQDLYGDIAFPLQITCFLSRPGEDYGGGEFLLVEQRPRSQSRGAAITAAQGELVIFPNSERPVVGQRGYYRAKVRHGVSRVAWGSRLTLGIIFHDAR
ncbi:MAG: prolyl 4-hydroxylase subunit alpha [Acidobacteria bacterium]|nr:MAG: prolyl 4-hydroxylase subunit alpha [Acidobacteriota bacterium]